MTLAFDGVLCSALILSRPWHGIRVLCVLFGLSSHGFVAQLDSFFLLCGSGVNGCGFLAYNRTDSIIDLSQTSVRTGVRMSGHALIRRVQCSRMA